MKWITNIIARLLGVRTGSSTRAKEVESLTQDEIDCIVRLALSAGARSHRYRLTKAIEVYRQALDRGVPLRSNIYMDYMAEVDHPCPDLRLRHHYREKIRAKHEKTVDPAP